MVCVACLIPLFPVPIVNLLPLLFDFIMAKFYALCGWEYRKPARAPPACPIRPAKNDNNTNKILTFLDFEEIDELEKDMKRPGYVPNIAQQRLAQEVTRFVHGEEGLSEALKATEALRPGAETKLDWKAIEAIAEDVTSCSLAYDQVLNLSLVDLSVSSGLLESKSTARRLLK